MFLIFFTSSAAACNSYMIGFKGLGGVFDTKAFNEYAGRNVDCSILFEHQQIAEAAELMSRINKPYEIYGFSAGAASIMPFLKKVKRQPRYIITVGAVSSTNVDFSLYEINFDNFFDDSGKHNKSPGIYVRNIPHNKIQQYVTDFFK
jgi:hypothetical protein